MSEPILEYRRWSEAEPYWRLVWEDRGGVIEEVSGGTGGEQEGRRLWVWEYPRSGRWHLVMQWFIHLMPAFFIGGIFGAHKLLPRAWQGLIPVLVVVVVFVIIFYSFCVSWFEHLKRLEPVAREVEDDSVGYLPAGCGLTAARWSGYRKVVDEKGAVLAKVRMLKLRNFQLSLRPKGSWQLVLADGRTYFAMLREELGMNGVYELFPRKEKLPIARFKRDRQGVVLSCKPELMREIDPRVMAGLMLAIGIST